MGVNIEKINLRIGEIVLDGFPAGDRYYIADAIERELKILFKQNNQEASFKSSAFNSFLAREQFEFTTGTKPAEIGRKVAQTIYGRLSK